MSGKDNKKQGGHPVHPGPYGIWKKKILPFRKLFSKRISGLPLEQKVMKY